MKSVQEALELMMPAFRPVGTERLALADALERNLAADVLARVDLPEFDNSAMDGYAVRAADVSGATKAAPRVLPLRGESRAGGPLPGPLAAGTTMRIFTGAPLPAGADAIVIQEDTHATGDQIAMHESAAPGDSVRPRGSDLAAGAVLVAKGARLGPGELGILAAQGFSAATVYRRPRVAILSTGDELRDISDPRDPGSIVNSNAYALAAQVRLAGGDPVILPNVPDDMDATLAALEQGLTTDLLLTCGGVSVGDYDLVKAAYAKVGIVADFWKVRIKPGKPLTFGTRGRVPVVGLPGNPISAMVTFEALVRPGIRAMMGDPRPYRARHEARLAVAHRHGTGRLELARATVTLAAGRLVATPLRLQGSGSLPSMVGADALLLLDEAKATFAAGEMLPVLLLRDELGSDVSPFAS